ncbi:hypothetical protein MPTK1_2g03220 [Marchantia polymorpha subsp. ruderalis]|uniref:2Fe-2S ferredoxin-type domain-containing protein n=1 Tax=Marchantia polymorpha TaxID=3197 RepID=A0A2R6WMC1_MARPO|nr:hypothetical protein MARPO_0075s0083 [Marchantia polymorpha]BBN00933.1 hypothetical protein Mp_2g03220 [Marchantia polymorpha subsp. ruderalis]|eukprot:PTQ34987.1 hypothetical protein MARPO_0075s0083 [Marchantia polymorpha]
MDSLVLVRHPGSFICVSKSPLPLKSDRACSGRTDERVWRRPQRMTSLVAALDTETASTSSSENPEQQGPPMIELQFYGPEAGSVAQTLTVQSGEKNMRKFMTENKLELYALYGKVMNCGGGGSCGTCLVDILEGQELLSERTDAEYKYLKKKPESWRLACQTIIGDKSNSGKVVVQRLPQNKKK